MYSWQTQVILAVLVVAGLGLKWGSALWRRTTAGRKLRQVLAELERTEPGWGWEEVLSRRAVVPPERNGAALVLAANRLIPEPGVNGQLDAALNALSPEAPLEPALIQECRAERERLAAALEVARTLKDHPDGRYFIAYTHDWLTTKLDDLAASRPVSVLLGLDAALCAQDNEPDKALASCCSLLNAGRAVGDDPTLFAQYTRIAARLRAIHGIERALAQGQPSAAALSATQKLLEQELPVPLLLFGAEGERAFMHRQLLALERGDLTLTPFLHGEPEADGRMIAAELLNKTSFRQVQAGMLGRFTELLHIAQRPTHEWRELAERFEKNVDAAPFSVRHCFLYIRPAPKAFLRHGAVLACTLTALAVERYRQAHGRWPVALTALQPAFLAAVPADPYDGQPLRYQALADGVAVYSLGLKGIDHGGRFERKVPPTPETDVGFRLWEVPQRRQLLT